MKDPPFPTRTRRRGVIPEQFPADGADREQPDVLASPTKKVRRELDTQPAATPTEPTRRKIAPDSATAKLLRRLEARRNAKKKSKA